MNHIIQQFTKDHMTGLMLIIGICAVLTTFTGVIAYAAQSNPYSNCKSACVNGMQSYEEGICTCK
jgi:hypothetical protein